jgi:hypothetical protein
LQTEAAKHAGFNFLTVRNGSIMPFLAQNGIKNMDKDE